MLLDPDAENDGQWRCYRCLRLHLTAEIALKCCNAPVYEVWQCLQCGELDYSRRRAVRCCENGVSLGPGRSGVGDQLPRPPKVAAGAS